MFVDQFTEAAVADPDRIRLSRLVDVKEDPAITARGKAFRQMIRVEVALRDGTRMERTAESLRDSERVSAAQVKRLINVVLDAECLDDAHELSRLLVAGGDADR